jgi:uncharacterized protein YlxW (UPF0749 family)
MMILGLLLTTQFRIQKQVTPDPSRLRNDELIAVLHDKEEELQAANQEREKLREQVQQLQSSLSAITPAPKEDTSELRMLAGLLEVQGPGVIVTLVETPEATAAKDRVADEDIWRVVNELLTAGAEAISVNGVRVTSVTGIRNVGNRILVNQTMVASPIEIQAIGDPTVLEASLRLRGGVIELLGRWGIKVTAAKSTSLRLPALRTQPTFRFAKPVKE